MKRIKLLFMDVDGTLTDGKIYMGARGEVCKAFDIKDGYGIHEILPKHGIIPIIITGRSSEIVKNRALELGVTQLYQGKHEKLETLQKLFMKFDCPPEQAAYIGDDILDLPCMQVCGICGCPSDAVPEIQAVSDYISTRKGGCGAVREFIDWMIEKQKNL